MPRMRRWSVSWRQVTIDALDESEDDHGVAQSCYVRDAGGLRATMFCMCGFVASGDSWEEAGAELDEHLDAE